MGSNGASTGGGGGVGPAGIKTDGTYGTKRDASRASRRNEKPRERDNERQRTPVPPPPKPKPILTPTTPEVSQVTETVATEPVSTQDMKDDIEERKLKTKRRGRSLTIYTGPRGVEEQPLTLGKPSLLGR